MQSVKKQTAGVRWKRAVLSVWCGSLTVLRRKLNPEYPDIVIVRGNHTLDIGNDRVDLHNEGITVDVRLAVQQIFLSVDKKVGAPLFCGNGGAAGG
ncbi:hypothetical protein D3C75_922040 [compost metagenome]